MEGNELQRSLITYPGSHSLMDDEKYFHILCLILQTFNEHRYTLLSEHYLDVCYNDLLKILAKILWQLKACYTNFSYAQQLLRLCV
jgi:hypothetical protein